MKKILSVILTMILILSIVPTGLFSITASAETSGYYTYTVSNGEATITDCDTSISGDVTIPDKLGGYPVTSIGNSAFSGCSNITGITIPSGVTSVGKNSFYQSSITTVYLPNSIKNIGSYAFCNSKNYITITYCGTKDQWSKVTRDQYWAIKNGRYVEDAQIDNYHNYNTNGLCSICKCGAEGSCGDNLNWEINPSTGTLNITGSGPMNDYTSSYPSAPWKYYSSSIKKVVVEAGVTSIGNYAFYGLGASDIVVPEGVTSIGESSFASSALKNITIPSTVTTIGGFAFLNCSLDKVHITDIGAWCSISFPNTSANPISGLDARGVLYLNGIMVTDLVIPDGTTKIGNNVFFYNKQLKSVVIPNSVESIGYEAFYHCENLESITIGNGVKNIGYGAFRYFKGTNLIIPNSVEKIGETAFANCYNLVSVSLGKNLKSVDYYAFYDCPNLENVYYSGSELDRENITFGTYNEPLVNATWHYNSCAGVLEHTYNNDCDKDCNVCGFARDTSHEYDDLYDKYCNSCGELREKPTGVTGDCIWTLDGTTLTISGTGAMADYTSTGPWGRGIWKVIIEDGVTNVGNYSFNQCHNLRGVSLGKDVTTIGNCAFSACTSLYNVSLPDNLTHIGNDAFTMCSLVSVYIPASVTSIGSGAFSLPYNYVLEGINVDQNNAVYSSDSCGVLFNKDKTILIKAPYRLSGSYVIPNSVTEISSDAFYYCHELTDITIPKNVTSIESHAFECDNLENVFYLGAESDKDTIGIDSSNRSLLNATWYHNSCLGQAEHSYDDNCDTTCDLCNQDRVAPHYYEWITDKDNTCGENGFKHEECSACHKKRNEGTIVDATENHTFEWIVDKDNTCGESGIKHEECTICHEKRNEDTVINATENHAFEWVVDKESTCGESGIKHEECSVCHTKRNEDTVINATANHTFKWIIDKESTCGEGGIKHEECSVCYAIRNENTEIVATGKHTFTDNNDMVCNICKQNFFLIRFDSNGGTGVSQIKVLANHSAVLPSTTPSKSGYNFAGWATTKNGDVKYQPNGTVYANGSISLYAQWNKICNDCAGDGGIICNSCLGSGQVTSVGMCDNCYGEGYMCVSCNRWLGVSRDNVHDKLFCSGGCTAGTSKCGFTNGRYYKCPYCYNHGAIDDYAYGGVNFLSCSTCNGTTTTTYYGKCKKCYGTGNTICTSCEGSGEVIRVNISAPDVPTLQSVNADTIILNSITNGEYSIDGVNWQESPIFDNLEAGQVYSFYQRYAKTDTTYSSPSSSALTVLAHEHIFDNACDTECNNCGFARSVTHAYEWVIDKSENCGETGIKHEECRVCHANRNENTKIAATGNHTFTDDDDMVCDICGQAFFLIRFDSNGGTTVTQIKVLSNQSAFLPSIVPSKSGYNFVGWATTKNGDVEYQPEDVLPNLNKSITLYAQWDKLCDPYAYEECYYCSGTGEKYSHSKTCSDCSGTGKEECYWCDGTGLGTSNCYKCSGTGNVEETCSRCNGSGKVAGQSKCLTCSSNMGMYVSADSWCKSQGHSISTTYLDCSTCGGDGKKLTKCSSCDGKGKQECYTCDGTGKKSCFYCDGSGTKKVYTDCAKCSGSGKTQITCSICNGTGIVIRSTVSPPPIPAFESISSNTVVLQAIPNGEYSMDGVTWQDSPIFNNLVEGQEYTFYQRYAKTDTTLTSESSVALTLKAHNHTYDNACDVECNICKAIRTITHTYSSECDTVCNICFDTRTVIEDHTYTDGCDQKCNECEYIRTLGSIGITSKPQQTEYLESKDGLDVTGGKLTLYYTDGTFGEITITPNMVSGFNNEIVGLQTLTVTYEGFEDTYDIEIVSKTLVSISVTTKPNKTTYIESTALDDTGMVLTLYYNNNTSETVTTGWVSEYDFSNVGTSAVTVTYGGKTCTYDVTVVAKTLTSIAVESEPDKLEYLEGDASLDTNGLVIRAYYNNDTSEIISGNYTVTGYTSTPGEKTITVTYQGKTATFAVNVKAKSVTSLSVTKKPNKLTYLEGDSFDKTGMVVTAYYNNNTSGAVTDYTVSGYTSTTGTKTITVSYGGKSATFTVTVNSRVPSAITSSKYTVSGTNISKIGAGTTVTNLLNGLGEGSYCKVYNGSSVVSGNTAVGTGMTVKIMDGNTAKATYTIIVTGDTNGDGNITVTDMIAIKAHVLKKSTLSGAYATAADTNGDNGISITDFIQVKAKILGKGTITAR